MIIFGHFSRFLASFKISFSSLQHPIHSLYFYIERIIDSVYVNGTSGRPLQYNGIQTIPKNAIYAYLMLMPAQECLYNGVSYGPTLSII